MAEDPDNSHLLQPDEVGGRPAWGKDTLPNLRVPHNCLNIDIEVDVSSNLVGIVEPSCADPATSEYVHQTVNQIHLNSGQL